MTELVTLPDISVAALNAVEQAVTLKIKLSDFRLEGEISANLKKLKKKFLNFGENL